MVKKRYNIGLVVADITEPFSNRFSQGAMKAAEKLDANLFIFPGKYAGKDSYSANIDSKYEYQYNALFSYAAAAEFDYLIVAVGTIAHALDSNQRKQMLEFFEGTPLLSVSAKIDGYDYIMYDNKSGIIQAVDYLVCQQGRKNIGMMAGDLANYECGERFNAYKEALKKNNLEFKNSYYISCDLSEKAVTEAEQLIILNPELDAIICANDMIATSVYEVLHKHNKHIGIDISVVGFDDLPFAEKLEPPLASVRADAFKLGEASVQKAMNFLEGVDDNVHYVGTEFIPRQSCYGQSDTDKAADIVFQGKREEIPEKFAYYITENSDVTPKYAELTSFSAGFIRDIEKRFIYKTTDENDLKYLINSLDIFFNKKLDIVNNITKVHDVIDCGYKRLIQAVPEENKSYVRQLYNYIYKRLCLDIAADYNQLEEKYAERVHCDNLFIRDTLMIMENLHDSYARMMRRLALIGSDTSFAYVFKEPVKYRYKDIFPKDLKWYFMGYVYGEDTFVVPKEKQCISTPQVFENEFLDEDRRHTLIAADLFSAEYQYGIILCEPHSPDFFEELELVSYQLSSVVKMLYLRNNQEKTFTELHSKNLLLEDISKFDELTGIYNLRGFYEEAGKLISKTKSEGSLYIVCYADMNDLKKVNDRYGHAEGDFSIKTVAECLKRLFGNTAVIGRMSGDEFAAIVPKNDIGEISNIHKRKQEIIQELNFDSGKPYLITITTGITEGECKDSYDLKELVDRAEGILYEAKTKNKK